MALQPVNLSAFQGSFRRTGGLADAFQQGRTFREQRRVRDEQSQLLQSQLEGQEIENLAAPERLELENRQKRVNAATSTEKLKLLRMSNLGQQLRTAPTRATKRRLLEADLIFGEKLGLGVSNTQAAIDLLDKNTPEADAELDELISQTISLGSLVGDVKASPRTEILADGTSISVLNNNAKEVRDVAGNLLTGQDAVDAVIAGNAAGVALQGERAGIRTQKAKEEAAAATLITRGVLAAESTAVIRRALTLMETIETGGIAAVSFAVRRTLGIEGADEGELSNSLGKAVLSQLRETFGAQFTQEEGDRLIRIEAGFNKSVANNKRLLGQTLKIAENIAKRARKAAFERGQEEVVADIDGLLTFSLDLEPPSKKATDEDVKREVGGTDADLARAAAGEGLSVADFLEKGKKQLDKERALQ